MDGNVLAVRTDNSWDYREVLSGARYQWSDKNFNANYGGIPKNVRLHIADRVYQTLPLYSHLGSTGVYVYATDGRGYSTARLLRERYGYQGEIRAIGDVLQDQLFLMARCGFDAFALRADKSIEKALAAFETFKAPYQAAVDQPQPLFRRRAA